VRVEEERLSPMPSTLRELMRRARRAGLGLEFASGISSSAVRSA
jgi:hypothetical protein